MLPKNLLSPNACILKHLLQLHLLCGRGKLFSFWLIISFLPVSYRNDELINLRMGDISRGLANEDNQKFIEFKLMFRKTNKDAKKGMRQIFVTAMD